MKQLRHYKELYQSYKNERKIMGWDTMSGALVHAPRYKDYGLPARLLGRYCGFRWKLEKAKLQRRNKKYWESQGFEYKR